MARFILVAILIACIACVLQATPVPEQETSNKNELDNAFKTAMESIQKSIQNVLQDPQLNELYRNGTQVLQNAAETVRQEIDKIIPKTN